MKTSQYRKRLNQLIEEEMQQMGVLMKQKKLVKGTVYLMRTKCGKRGCRCEREGKLHSAWCLSKSQDGKSRVRCLSKEKVVGYKKLTGSYRRFRQARAGIANIHKAQIETINLLEKALQQPGVVR